MEIQPTIEYTSGHMPVVDTSASGLDWICTMHLRKEADKKASE